MKTKNSRKNYMAKSCSKNNLHGDIAMSYPTDSDNMFFDLNYKVGKGQIEDSFSIKSNLPKTGQISLLESFLASQIGQGADRTPPKMRKSYHISLKYSPEDRSDRRIIGTKIEVSYDTKNKGLRDGILMSVLQALV